MFILVYIPKMVCIPASETWSTHLFVGEMGDVMLPCVIQD